MLVLGRFLEGVVGGRVEIEAWDGEYEHYGPHDVVASAGIQAA